MSRKSKTTQSTTQQQSGQQAGTSTSSVGETPDIAAARGFQFRPSPRIPHIYGQLREKLRGSFQNPIGGNYSPNMRDAILRSGERDIAQRESMAESEANADLQGAQFGQKMGIAALTAPRTASYSGTSSGTSSGSGVSQTSQPLWPDLIGAGATGAAA